MPLMWRKDKHDGRGRIKICFIIFNDCVTNSVLSTAVREDSSAFCFPFYGHSKRKIPRQAACLPWEMKGQACACRALRLNLAAAASALAAAGAAAAGHYAAREVVASEEDLEVVGDK